MPVVVRPAGVGALKIGPAGKLGCYGVWGVLEICATPSSVAARLAGGGVLKIAIAGKPDCYVRRGCARGL